VTAAGQHLGAERALQVQLRPGQQRLRLPRRQAENLTEIHLMPGAELEHLELGRFQAHRRVPRQQAVVGIIAAKAHRRLVGVGRGHGMVPPARGPRERVELRAGGTRRRGEQGVAQGGLRGFAAPEHAPAVEEEPVGVALKEFSRCDLGVIHGQEARA
jgi:hypothetical protein